MVVLSAAGPLACPISMLFEITRKDSANGGHATPNQWREAPHDKQTVPFLRNRRSWRTSSLAAPAVARATKTPSNLAASRPYAGRRLLGEHVGGGGGKEPPPQNPKKTTPPFGKCSQQAAKRRSSTIEAVLLRTKIVPNGEMFQGSFSAGTIDGVTFGR